MILKGNARKNGSDLAVHLLNSFDNEHIEVADIRGTAASDLLGAFTEIEAVASGTNCKKPLYSLSINPPSPLTPSQYIEALTRIESALGLSGQPRAIVMHRKAGREHCHVVWSRIDLAKMQAIHLSHDRLKLKALARELSQRFGLKLPPWMHEKPGNTHAENAQSAATGITPEQRRHDITEAYMASDNAASFRAALADLGYTLARGDKRGFVVMDRYGAIHSLTRQIKNVRTQHILDRFAPLTPAELPHVDDLTTPDEQPDPAEHTRLEARLSRLIRQNHAKRRALLYRDSRALEKKQAEEMRALEDAQRRDDAPPLSFTARFNAAANPLALFTAVVMKLVRAFPALRSVLRSVRRPAGKPLRERHAAELEALRRKHSRQWQEFLRRERLTDLLHKRELSSLDNAVWRALRLSQRKAEAVSINALDITAPGQAIDNELAELEREYQTPEISLTDTFNAAANPGHTKDDDGDDNWRPPTYASRFNKNAR